MDPGVDSNLHSNLTDYAHGSSDIDMSQYQFSSNFIGYGPRIPSTLSDATDHSATSMTVPVPECRSNDPGLQQLAYAIIRRGQFLHNEQLPDLYVAQFFFVESVPSSTQPSRNKSKRSDKPRPETILAYHCLWCGRWVGYTKEKARQHFLVDLNMKGIACQEPGW